MNLKAHVLSLRESELESRLHERDRRIADLELNLKEHRLKLAQDAASIESLNRQLQLAAKRDQRRRAPRVARTQTRVTKKARRPATKKKSRRSERLRPRHRGRK